MLYNQEGRMKAIKAPQKLPRIFIKSVKLGISIANPVIIMIISDLPTIILAFFWQLVPDLKNFFCSRISNAHKICTG